MTMAIMSLQAGGQLDALMAERVMGWKVYRYGSATGVYQAWLERFQRREPNVLYLDNEGRLGGRYSEELTLADDNEEPQCEDWSPSIDIRAAFEVAAKIGTIFSLHWMPDPAMFDKGPWPGTGPWVAGLSNLTAMRGETAPLAICRMALIAAEDRSRNGT